MEQERIAEGFMLYASMWEEYEEMYNDDPALAAEYLRALGRYNFYGEEYKGPIPTIRYIMKTQMELIDNQRIRYNKAVKGGKGGAAITDEELIDAVNSGEYASQAELGRAFGVSRQAINQRMRKLGLELRPVSSLDKICQAKTSTNVNLTSTSMTSKSTSTNPTNTITTLAQESATEGKKIWEELV